MQVTAHLLPLLPCFHDSLILKLVLHPCLSLMLPQAIPGHLLELISSASITIGPTVVHQHQSNASSKHKYGGVESTKAARKDHIVTTGV